MITFIESVNLTDVINNDNIKYNTSNHWENGIQPEDYEKKITDTYTNKWIHLFKSEYIKIELNNHSDILWMKKGIMLIMYHLDYQFQFQLMQI